MESELLMRVKELEDAFNKTTDSALQLMEINKEHQRINGELREENKRLNNIINELEKWLEDIDKNAVQSDTYWEALDKLQELRRIYE